MPLMLQIWIVIVTLGLLGIALVALRTMTRIFEKVAQDISLLSLAIRETAARVDLVTNEAREIVGPVRDCVPPFLRIVRRFESIGQRTADVSSTILEEVARPVYTAAAVARGVRTGATYLVKRWKHRLTPSHSSTNGDHDDE